MWRQQFPMEDECRVEQRKDVEKWTITLSFPMAKNVQRGNMPALGI